jgi:sucrose phosphorylase
MLSLQGVPGIYFHSLFGSRGDRTGAVTSGIHRRINRQKLQRPDLERELSMPATLRARVFGGFRDLLALRRAHRAFAPNAPQRVLNLDARVFAVLRESADGNDRVLCLHNVSGQPVQIGAWDAFSANKLGPFETKWLAAD